MAVKLVTLVALFSLVLSAAAFAGGASIELADETGGEAGEREVLVQEHDQEEEEFILYLGPRNETVAASGDRRVD